MNTFEIELNGEPHRVQGGTVIDLIRELQLEQRKFAVEINRNILPRDSFASTQLNPGDRVEIIHFVGGG